MRCCNSQLSVIACRLLSSRPLTRVTILCWNAVAILCTTSPFSMQLRSKTDKCKHAEEDKELCSHATLWQRASMTLHRCNFSQQADKNSTGEQPVDRCGHGCAPSWHAWSGAEPTRGTCRTYTAPAATPDHTNTASQVKDTSEWLLNSSWDGRKTCQQRALSCAVLLCMALQCD